MRNETVSSTKKIILFGELLVRYICYFLALRTLTDFPSFNSATDLGLIIELYTFKFIKEI